MSKIGELAVSIYDNEIGFETGSARSTQVSLISGWLLSRMGELNTVLYSSFSGDNPSNWNLEEQSIMTQMYLVDYNWKAQRRVLRGIDGSTEDADFEVIREGDSMIRKSNKNATAKAYRDAALDAKDQLSQLIYAYNLYQAKPNQVVGKDAPASTGSNLDGYYT